MSNAWLCGAYRLALCGLLAGGCVAAAPADDRPAAPSDDARIPIYDAGTGEVRLMEKVSKTDAEWRRQLTPEQYRITRRKGTERAFTSPYHAQKTPGVYRCVCCGIDLYSSMMKFDSGTGWPSFWAPVDERNLRYARDASLFMERTEVLCARCDAHLGHVFEDGPAPTGQRHCINAAALEFQAAPSASPAP